jgi:hypothetical protein
VNPKLTNRVRILSLTFVLGLIVALFAVSGARAQVSNGLQFEDTDPVSVTLAPGKADFQVHQTLRNNDTKTVNVRLSTILLGSDAKLQSALVQIAGTDGTLGDTLSVPGGSVVPILAVITLAQPGNLPLSGHLIASADGGPVAPATVPVQIAAEESGEVPIIGGVILPHDLGTGIILSSFVVAGLLLLLLWLWRLPKAIHGFRSRKFVKGGLPQWDVKQSFVANFTIISALLGGTVSVSVLPDETAHLSSKGYVLLSIFFALLLLVAPILFNSSVTKLRSEDEPTKKEPYGRIAPFMFTVMLVLWALIGEIIAVLYILDELRIAGSLSGLFVTVSQLLVLFAGVLMLAYVFKATPSVIGDGKDPHKEVAPTKAPGTESQNAIQAVHLDSVAGVLELFREKMPPGSQPVMVISTGEREVSPAPQPKKWTLF